MAQHRPTQLETATAIAAGLDIRDLASLQSSIAQRMQEFLADPAEVSAHRTQLACEKALQTPELLEHILFNLPTKDLLLAQQVSKSWQANIKASKKLQQALFFRPADGGPVEYKEWETEGDEPADDFDLFESNGYFEYGFVEPDTDNTMVVYLNPLLEPLADGLRHKINDVDVVQRLPAAWQFENASWKRMYLTQPPVRNLHFMVSNEQPDGSGIGTHMILNTALGSDMVENLRSEVKKNGYANGDGWGFRGQSRVDLWKQVKDNAEIEELPKAYPEGEGREYM